MIGKPKNARETALFALQAIETEDLYSDQALNQFADAANLDSRERGLAARLLYGVLQNRYLCDFYIRSYSKIRLKKIQPVILLLLELAVYQIVFMDRIPNNAAVNESLELMKRFGKANPRTIGFANGILRSIVRDVDQLPALNEKTKAEYYSIRYSHSLWMVQKWIEQFGVKTTQEILQADNEIPPICLRVNLEKGDPEAVLKQLQAEGVSAYIHPDLANLILCPEGLPIAKHPLFLSGIVTVQDGASMTAVDVLAPQKDSLVLDCCAAPGGKSFYIAEKLKNTGKVISCDIYPEKLKKIQQGSQRLGLLNLETRLQDASKPVAEWVEKADFVLCDVPCSGLGIIRKKPEIRYKSDEELAELPEIQFQILRNAAQYVKKGGTLVYSTCTILQRENQDVVQRFLKESSEFRLCGFKTPITDECPQGFFTFLPGKYQTDGFFIAKLSKI
jgi:16S rRNA (cytosine967-C5)-methyltransferase